MSSTRDIKQRIENVSSVEQIIKAMDMVSSTKLVRARKQLEGIRPIYYELKRIVGEVGMQKNAKSNIYYKEQEVKDTLYIILTSDKGLCGSYNSNIMSKALNHMNQGKNEKILVVGSKGYEYFKKRDKNIIRSIVDVADSKVYYGAESLANWLMDIYLSSEVEEVYIAYTHFENVLNHVPIVEKLLPVASGAIEDLDIANHRYEPNLNTFIDNMIPLYLHMTIFRAFSESHTSEQAARMVNMDAAGKNASEIIEDLTRMYNRKRQAAITQEINEIVGSVNILNKGGPDDS